MRSATLYPYSLPMEAGVVLRHQRLKSRDGLVVRLERDGCVGEGEIAPLPGFSRENLEEAGQTARNVVQHWVNGDDMLDTAQGLTLASGKRVILPPSVAFGVSVALAELDKQLPQETPYETVPLSTGSPNEVIPMLAGLTGGKIAKIKVGLYEAIRDSMVVNLLLDAVPELHVRLDANRSWTPAKAGQFARYLDPAFIKRIDFLEEPCATPAQSLAFAHDTGIPIAWDETLRDGGGSGAWNETQSDAGFQLSALPGLRAAVIKPTLTGSLAQCRALVKQGREAGLMVVISSAIETSLGLTQLSRLAAWLTPECRPGLDTLSLMQSQLIRPWRGCRLPLLTHGDLSPLKIKPA